MNGWLNKKNVGRDQLVASLSGIVPVEWYFKGTTSPYNEKTCFVVSDSYISAFEVSSDGTKSTTPWLRGTFRNVIDIQWEIYFAPTTRNGHPLSPAGWQPVISCNYDKEKNTMTMIVPTQTSNQASKDNGKNTTRLVFRIGGDSNNAEIQ